MTSLYPDVHGVMNWENNKPAKRLDDSIPTLANILKNHNYTTVAFTGGAHVHASRGFDKGFDSYNHHNSYYNVIDETINWIDNNYRKKFFLFFHTYAVHDPYLPPSPYNRKYDPDYQGTIIDSGGEMQEGCKDRVEWWWQQHERFWNGVNKNDPRDIYFLKALYDGAINHMDEQIVAPLLEKLQDKGIYKNTMIIFTSDHGEAFKEHKTFLHDDLYKETLHIPLIIVSPKTIPQHVKVKQLVRTIDIMPTILDILEIDKKIYMQGTSLVPAINGKELNLSCYSSHNIMKHYSFESIRTNEFSYIFKNWPKDSYQHLYDRSKDSTEQQSIIEKKPKIVKQLTTTLSQTKTICKNLNFQKSHKEVLPDSETVKRLKSLGYAQ